MIDAAQYIKLTWDAISDGTKNAFNKSELLTLRGGGDAMADRLLAFKTLNIPIDESIIEEFVHIDGKNNKVFSKDILDDVNEVFETCKQRTTIQKMRVAIRLLKLAHHFQNQQKTMSVVVGLSLCTKKPLKLIISCCVLTYKLK